MIEHLFRNETVTFDKKNRVAISGKKPPDRNNKRLFLVYAKF